MKLEDEIKQSKFESESQKVKINIIFTGKWLENKTNALLKPHGLSMQQFNLLRILRGQHPEPVTVNLIIERMLDKMSNASRLVEKLRVKGFVERRQCEVDRRAVDVVITEKGLALLKEVDHLVLGDNTGSSLSDDEMKQLNRLLDKFRD